MPKLDFRVLSAERALTHGGAAAVRLTFAITNEIADEDVHGGALECGLRLEPALRSYSPEEEVRLVDVFGPQSGWREALRPRPWAHVSVDLPAFRSTATLEVLVPCSPGDGDATARYVESLDGGDIPIRVLYRGRVLFGLEEAPSMRPIPHSTETAFRLPLAVFPRSRVSS